MRSFDCANAPLRMTDPFPPTTQCLNAYRSFVVVLFVARSSLQAYGLLRRSGNKKRTAFAQAVLFRHWVVGNTGEYTIRLYITRYQWHGKGYHVGRKYAQFPITCRQWYTAKKELPSLLPDRGFQSFCAMGVSASVCCSYDLLPLCCHLMTRLLS